MWRLWTDGDNRQMEFIDRWSSYTGGAYRYVELVVMWR